jgi:hypothetical protein
MRPAPRPAGRRLCIVARRRPLRWPALVEALQISLDPEERLEIIVDRRHKHAATNVPNGSAGVERRRPPGVSLGLKMDGFAIVPPPGAPSPTTRDASRPQPLARSPKREVTFEADASGDRSVDFPIGERLAPRAVADFLDDDLDEVLATRRARPRSRWVAAAMTGLVAGASLVVLASRIDTVALWAHRPLTGPPAADRVERPPAAPLGSPERVPAESDGVQEPARADTAGPPVVLPPAPAAPASIEADAGPPRRAVTPPARQAAPARRSPRTPRFPGVPEVTLVRGPGQGADYTVLIADAAGRPLPGAEVSLVGRRPNGTVFDTPLGPGREPGTYLGGVPRDGGEFVDLRVRVVMGDKRVEIPVRP